ncbi:YicC/YloC family endoribonuclease [Pseudohalocynthiibacter aestuariivivens]|uniref:YicC/YloC family endoribonuclease n=1 Tax=Pseudohalocynthiibacter aestuariivivens TaxID=1591409 RepID=A0ABV5JIM6_9RHOB|nr:MULTISPECIES: YicC/YloC family endoribonuclease [Pseudohalocynthiibacter]MCK0100854.1 YicC family protein [Pseudohalocynthiibacter sp. F2068]
MTGFATGRGQNETYSWTWELRSVNAKGLDLRLRVPDWISGLEQALRGILSKRIARGSVNLTLRVLREDSAETQSLNQDQMRRVLAQIAEVEIAAAEADISLVPTRASDVMAQRGVLEMSSAEDDSGALMAALLADFEPLVADFSKMRASEGAALQSVISGQIDHIGELTKRAKVVAEDRKPKVAEQLRANLALVLENMQGVDESRLAQELALLAVKADVTEEIDRLMAHVDAANELLKTKGSIGRKLDFLMQEFMREANTLCSKSQSVDLTSLGLDLKATIDQMREQVQNVE